MGAGESDLEVVRLLLPAALVDFFARFPEGRPGRRTRHLVTFGYAAATALFLVAALATQAARSPRAGYELLALLARVPLGAWRLESKRPARSRKKAPPPPSRRGRRKKGTS